MFIVLSVLMSLARGLWKLRPGAPEPGASEPVEPADKDSWEAFMWMCATENTDNDQFWELYRWYWDRSEGYGDSNGVEGMAMAGRRTQSDAERSEAATDDGTSSPGVTENQPYDPYATPPRVNEIIEEMNKARMEREQKRAMGLVTPGTGSPSASCGGLERHTHQPERQSIQPECCLAEDVWSEEEGTKPNGRRNRACSSFKKAARKVRQVLRPFKPCTGRQCRWFCPLLPRIHTLD